MSSTLFDHGPALEPASESLRSAVWGGPPVVGGSRGHLEVDHAEKESAFCCLKIEMLARVRNICAELQRDAHCEFCGHFPEPTLCDGLPACAELGDLCLIPGNFCFGCQVKASLSNGARKMSCIACQTAETQLLW